MTIEEAVRARLLEINDLDTLVDGRVYTEMLPQSPEYPCVLVQLVEDRDFYTQLGRAGVQVAGVLVEAFARETSAGDPYDEANQVAQAIDGDGKGLGQASGLAGYKGTPGGSPAGPSIDVAFRTQRRRGYIADELRIQVISQEYRVWFHPAN